MFMQKSRNSKFIIIVVLMILVIGLSIGFSAFTNIITIKSGADVKPSATSFNVDFSSASGKVENNKITPTLNPTTLTATSAVIDNTGDPTISGLGVTFTEPGQSATYTFYSHNSGEYTSYLKSITFGAAEGTTLSKACTASTGTSQELVNAACNSISLSIKVGNDAAVTQTIQNITSHSLAKNTSEPIIITISYGSGAQVADGDFVVKFGDITLNYSSVD